MLETPLKKKTSKTKLICTYVNNHIHTFIHFILQMQPSLPKQFASKAAKSPKSRRPSQAADVDQCRRLCLQLRLLPVKIFFSKQRCYEDRVWQQSLVPRSKKLIAFRIVSHSIAPLAAMKHQFFCIFLLSDWSRSVLPCQLVGRNFLSGLLWNASACQSVAFLFFMLQIAG